MIKPPMFITFEGIDGSGKTTQAKLFAKYLSDSLGAETVVFVREPGGTGISEKIRAIILDTANYAMTGMAETLLYAAARAQLVGEVIKPALESGKTVICDRFLDSSVAYQGAARGIRYADVETINSFAVGGLTPDMTFLIAAGPELRRERLEAKNKNGGFEPDRLESESAGFFLKVADGYAALAERYPERIAVIDASGGISDIHARIINAFNEKYKGK